MKTWVILLATGLLAGSAQAADVPGVIPGLSAKGEGSWEIICQVYGGGEQKGVIIDSHGSSYADPRLTRAECDYRASPASDLMVSLTGAQTCPFAGAPADSCSLTVPKGKRGSFVLKVGRPR